MRCSSASPFAASTSGFPALRCGLGMAPLELAAGGSSIWQSLLLELLASDFALEDDELLDFFFLSFFFLRLRFFLLLAELSLSEDELEPLLPLRFLSPFLCLILLTERLRLSVRLAPSFAASASRTALEPAWGDSPRGGGPRSGGRSAGAASVKPSPRGRLLPHLRHSKRFVKLRSPQAQIQSRVLSSSSPRPPPLPAARGRPLALYCSSLSSPTGRMLTALSLPS
mmetsp:Transcript_55691/g.154282  ORF Transcript_55691/g.154282 Transcript_55691/m.154282 type:complete len:226 (-) Transcript_55691:215-892(-)